MKKIIWGIVGVVVIVLIVISVSRTRTSDTVKIGFITFPTGPVAVPGQMSVVAAKYAEEMINKNGGVNGKKLEVLIEDYAYDAKRAIPSYEALRAKGVNMFIFEGSPAGAAIPPLAKQNKDLLITGVTTLPSYTDGNPLTCRIGLTAANYGPAMAEYIAKKFINPRIAFIVPSNDYGKGIELETTKALIAKGGKVIDVETYDQTSGDYRTQVSKLKSLQNSYDYLVFIDTANTIEALLKQMRDLGLKKPIITDAVSAQNPGLKDKSYVEGWTVADYEYTPTVNDTDSQMVKTYKTEYTARSNFSPITAAGTTYDGIFMIVKALENGAKTPADVSDYFINKMGIYQGVTGAISVNGDCESQRPVVYREFKAGKLVDVK